MKLWSWNFVSRWTDQSHLKRDYQLIKIPIKGKFARKDVSSTPLIIWIGWYFCMILGQKGETRFGKFSMWTSESSMPNWKFTTTIADLNWNFVLRSYGIIPFINNGNESFEFLERFLNFKSHYVWDMKFWYVKECEIDQF